jgi:hypothetical protein
MWHAAEPRTVRYVAEPRTMRYGVAEPCTVRYMAERVGFEPTSRFLVNTLSKRAPSATRTPLRGHNA